MLSVSKEAHGGVTGCAAGASPPAAINLLGLEMLLLILLLLMLLVPPLLQSPLLHAGVGGSWKSLRAQGALLGPVLVLLTATGGDLLHPDAVGTVKLLLTLLPLTLLRLLLPCTASGGSCKLRAHVALLNPLPASLTAAGGDLLQADAVGAAIFGAASTS